MEDLFRDFWWLLFPLAFILAGAWNAFIARRREADRLALLRTYIDKGREPPAELLRSVNRTEA